MYLFPGHHVVTSLFFKPHKLDAYRARRRDWSLMFATDGYVLQVSTLSYHLLIENSGSLSLRLRLNGGLFSC